VYTSMVIVLVKLEMYYLKAISAIHTYLKYNFNAFVHVLPSVFKSIENNLYVMVPSDIIILRHTSSLVFTF
jgi:hypothetical protein